MQLREATSFTTGVSNSLKSSALTKPGQGRVPGSDTADKRTEDLWHVPSGDSTLLLLVTGPGERAELQQPPPKGQQSLLAPMKVLTNTLLHKSKHSVVLRLKLKGFKICGRAGEPFWLPFKVWYYLSIFDRWEYKFFGAGVFLMH